MTLPTPPVRLTREEVRERLRLNSGGLIEEIHALMLRLNQGEDQRESRLDAKAQGLLGTTALSLTVAFTFGALLLQHPDYVAPFGKTLSYTVYGLYAVAMLFGLSANIWAVRALYVSDGYGSVTDDDVFNAFELARIDEQHASSDERARAEYRRFITVQHWTIFSQNYVLHDRKASLIKAGQLWFVLFLLSLLLIGASLSYAAFEQYINSNPNASSIPHTVKTP